MGLKERFYVDVMACHPEVSGSCHLIIVKYPNGETTKFLVDCGLFQEKEYAEYNAKFPFDASNIKFCLVTHNHIDHIGRLPLLVRKGFKGKIYASKTTAMLARASLRNSCKIMKQIAKRNHQPRLFSERDLGLTSFTTCNFNETIDIDPQIKVTFLVNGHLPGAAMILVQMSCPEHEDINLLFTGDYNNKNMFFDVPNVPNWILSLPLTVIQESTYGAMESTEMHECFENNVLQCINRNRTAICMTFSLGRTQEILYVLKCMQDEGKLDPKVPILLDGELAQEYTKIYVEQEIGIKAEMRDFLPKNLTYVDQEIRQDVLDNCEKQVILTSSGSGNYGPSQTYISKYISKDGCLLQFTGYTPEGSLGDRLKMAELGELVMIGSVLKQKNAEVEYTTEFSAHAKADEMIAFLKRFKQLQLVLVNHGREDVKLKFSERIASEVQPDCVAILNRDYFFRIDSHGLAQQLPTKFY